MSDGLDGFEFLAMAEAGEFGHWAVLGNGARQVRVMRKKREVDPQNRAGDHRRARWLPDIGDIVSNTQAGALYRYDLLWAVALGTIGIAVYAEMCGRVAAVTGRPVLDEILVGRGSLLKRLRGPEAGAGGVRWENVVEVGEQIVVRF